MLNTSFVNIYKRRIRIKPPYITKRHVDETTAGKQEREIRIKTYKKLNKDFRAIRYAKILHLLNAQGKRYKKELNKFRSNDGIVYLSINLKGENFAS